MDARSLGLLILVVASGSFAQKPLLRGGEVPPQDLRLTGCALNPQTVRHGRLFEITPEGRGPQVLWVGLVGKAEPHLVFAWYPRGRPAKARCVDAGLVDPWAVELSTVPSVPLLRAIQTQRGECHSLSRTVVLAWTNGGHDFELVSSRTSVSPRLLCGQASLEQEPDDERLLRASELMSDGAVQDAERLMLGLVGERPWDPDARAALAQTWRKLNSAGRR